MKLSKFLKNKTIACLLVLLIAFACSSSSFLIKKTRFSISHEANNPDKVSNVEINEDKTNSPSADHPIKKEEATENSIKEVGDLKAKNPQKNEQKNLNQSDSENSKRVYQSEYSLKTGFRKTDPLSSISSNGKTILKSMPFALHSPDENNVAYIDSSGH